VPGHRFDWFAERAQGGCVTFGFAVVFVNGCVVLFVVVFEPEFELGSEPSHPTVSSPEPEHDRVLLSIGFFFILAANNDASNIPSS
jgi:hypothetical protein